MDHSGIRAGTETTERHWAAKGAVQSGTQARRRIIRPVLKSSFGSYGMEVHRMLSEGP
jgi:hypothetical protein